MVKRRLLTSLFKGVSYGLASGVITTLGLVIGIYFSTRSYIAIIAGLISIAIADSFSDALGIHVSEESEKKTDVERIWTATLVTLFTKLVVALSFLIPFIFLTIDGAFFVSIIWGVLLLTLLSYYLAKRENVKPFGVIAEHLSIAFLVIIATYLAGIIINMLINK